MSLLEGIQRALLSKDAAAIAEAFAPDALLYGLGPPLAIRGLDRAFLESWLATWDGGVRMSTADVAITVDGALAVARRLTRMEGRRILRGRSLRFFTRPGTVLCAAVVTMPFEVPAHPPWPCQRRP